VEAFASRKAVITATDSGGPVELVRDGETGFIVRPDPKEVAEKLDLLASDPGRAEKMGEKAFRMVSGMTWQKAVRKLIIE
jgi:glycosyltransferase involved in cell wall biosynthesis